MAKTITQKIVFKDAKASSLYNMYLDSREHTKLTGNNPAKISAKEGAKFSIYDGTLILSFEQNKNDVVINMIHANVPDNQASALKDGWNDFYWKPWKKYLAEK